MGSMRPTYKRECKYQSPPFCLGHRESAPSFTHNWATGLNNRLPFPFPGAAAPGPHPTVGSSCPLVARARAGSLVSRPRPQTQSFWPGALLDLGRSLELGQPLLNALAQWPNPKQG